MLHVVSCAVVVIEGKVRCRCVLPGGLIVAEPLVEGVAAGFEGVVLVVVLVLVLVLLRGSFFFFFVFARR